MQLRLEKGNSYKKNPVRAPCALSQPGARPAASSRRRAAQSGAGGPRLAPQPHPAASPRGGGAAAPGPVAAPAPAPAAGVAFQQRRAPERGAAHGASQPGPDRRRRRHLGGAATVREAGGRGGGIRTVAVVTRPAGALPRLRVRRPRPGYVTSGRGGRSFPRFCAPLGGEPCAARWKGGTAGTPSPSVHRARRAPALVLSGRNASWEV